MEIKGQTAVVTGSARGIGRAIAEALAVEGARVILADLGSLAEEHSAEWSYKFSAKEEKSRNSISIYNKMVLRQRRRDRILIFRLF